MGYWLLAKLGQWGWNNLVELVLLWA
jgi:hypothetical protein